MDQNTLIAGLIGMARAGSFVPRPADTAATAVARTGTVAAALRPRAECHPRRDGNGGVVVVRRRQELEECRA